MNNNLIFLKELIKTEKENIKSDLKKRYNSVKDKYMNGECEILAYYFYLLNNKTGNIIELKKKDEILNRNVFHYIYELNGKFYDILGESNDLINLAKRTKLFGDCTNIIPKVIEPSLADNIANDKLFKNIIANISLEELNIETNNLTDLSWLK